MVKDHLENEYESIIEMCKAYSINPSTYKFRILSGMSVEDALLMPLRKNTCIDHMGNTFSSINKMCKYYNINKSTFSTRIKSGMSLKDALTQKIALPTEKGTECFDHKGNRYESYAEMAKAYHIPASVLRDRLNRGLSVEDALRKREVVDHTGKKYRSETQMCQEYGIAITTFKHRQKMGMSLKDSLTIPVGNMLGNSCVDHLGNIYKSERDMCAAYKIEHSTFMHRIGKGMSIEEALMHYEVYDHNGIAYKSEVEMCKAYGIANETFRYRRRAGFSVEEALTIPKHYSLGEYRVSKVLDQFCNDRKISSYLHNIQINKLFEILNIQEQYNLFMKRYDNELKKSNINISRKRLARFRFDFSIIKDANIWAFIEYDGIQHFKFVDLFFKTFEDFVLSGNRDSAKNIFTEVNGIPLLRIRYDQIEEKMVKEMIDDLLGNPQKYVIQHNTFLSNEEYMEAFNDNMLDVNPKLS